MVKTAHKPLKVAACLAVASVVGHLFGLAGYRAGWPLTALLVVGGTGLVAWRTVSDEPTRGVWLATTLVLAVTATAWLVDHAPLSRPRVAALARASRPDFARVVTSRRSGHSWCRPHCPRVEEVLRLPDLQPGPALISVAAKMRLVGLLDDLLAVGNRHPRERFRVVSDKAITDVRARNEGGQLTIEITVTARRGSSGGPDKIQAAAAMIAAT